MSDTDPSAAVGPPGDDYHVAFRTVAAGRGWDWIAEGFDLFRKQPGIWILAALVLGVIFIVISMIPVLGSLANALLFPIFGAGLMLGCRDLAQGGALQVEDLFAGFKQKTGDLVMIGAFNLFGWVVIAFAVFAVVGGGVLMGTMRGGAPGAGISIMSMLIAMLLVAGLSVPLYMATWFAPALIVLHDTPPGAALKASFFACLANWLPFLIYGFVMLVLCLVAAIPLLLGVMIYGGAWVLMAPVFVIPLFLALLVLLGLLVLVAVFIASVYTSYRDIFRTGQ